MDWNWNLSRKGFSLSWWHPLLTGVWLREELGEYLLNELQCIRQISRKPHCARTSDQQMTKDTGHAGENPKHTEGFGGTTGVHGWGCHSEGERWGHLVVGTLHEN